MAVADADRVDEAWRALGQQLAASRRAAGLTQKRLAPLAGYSRSTIANAETGRQRTPGDFWRRCDDVLGTRNALFRGYDEVVAIAQRTHVQAAATARNARAILEGAASGEVSLPGEGRVRDDPVGRPPRMEEIESIRESLSGTLSDSAVSRASLDAWDQAVLHVGQMTRYRPPGELLFELSADLSELDRAMRRCRSPGSLRRLARVAAQLSGLMCLLLVKLDERTAFRRWARTARSAAGEAGDPVIFSWVLAQEAYGHYYSADLATSVSVARYAQGLMRGTPCVGAVLAAAVEARAHAGKGDAREARRALGRAENILSALEPGSLAASAFGYSESQFRFHEGSVYTRLGATRLAFRAHERALEVCPPGDYTDWALTRLDRARCLAHDGDPVAAATYATETLTRLSGEQTQGIIAVRGHELIRALPPTYRAVSAVREMQELLLQER
jgi:Helix-turn-helix domain